MRTHNGGKQSGIDQMNQATSIDAFTSATALMQALNEQRISATELVELYLQRIKRYNPILNAVIVIDEEAARQSAKQADEMRSRGERGALLGLPLTIKESLDVAELPGTIGVPLFAQRRAEKDARIVERARAAGAVILGKTNVPPYLADWQTDNPLYGRTNNPWNLAYTPGGSTGGGAAALAAGLTPSDCKLSAPILRTVRQSVLPRWWPRSLVDINAHRDMTTIKRNALPAHRPLRNRYLSPGRRQAILALRLKSGGSSRGSHRL